MASIRRIGSDSMSWPGFPRSETVFPPGSLLAVYRSLYEPRALADKIVVHDVGFALFVELGHRLEQPVDLVDRNGQRLHVSPRVGSEYVKHDHLGRSLSLIHI